MFTSKKFWIRFIIGIIIIPLILITTTITIVYFQQEKIVQHILKTANEDFKGKIVIKGSHIAPFANFPYISIDLEGFQVFETKDKTLEPVIDLDDVYIGFDLWTLLAGNYDVKSIKLANGRINIVEYEDNSFNISKAFEPTTPKEIEELQEEFHFDLQSIALENVEIDKINPEDLEFEVMVNKAQIGLRSKKEHLYLSLKTDFNLSMIDQGDTTFLNNKPFSINSVLDYNKMVDSLIIPPSDVNIGNVRFDFGGGIDLKDDVNVDVYLSGKKSDFSLIIALAPDDLIPVFKTFENRGDVFFDASIKGKSAFGFTPQVEARFGCKEGYFKNPKTDKVLDEVNFVGYFTNGEYQNLESSRFELKDFNARPETGRFKVNLTMDNFVSPEIDLNMTTLFDLDYLAKFLNVEDLQNLTGRVELVMNFRDIIDLENPEKSIEKFNESYYSLLKVDNLGFDIPGYDERIEDINVSLIVDGNKADLKRFSLKVGGSDLSISGSVSDLPAIIHHTNTPVDANLSIRSKAMDINELTLARGDQVVEEYIKNFQMDLAFHSSAKAITESPYLPVGKFIISQFNAELTNYPHAIHDFHAEVIIDTTDLSIVDFSGFIDQSDFHFSGKVKQYPMWFQETLDGDTHISFDLTSNLLQLKDIFSYDGENYVPEDYREEELRHLKIHGDVELHFNNGKFSSSDLYLKELKGKANIHPMKLENFGGRIHVEKDHLTMTKFRGTIGNSSFVMDLDYYFGELAEAKTKPNKLIFHAKRLDFDQLFNYEAPPAGETVEHDSVFSIFDIPFPDMQYQVKIGKMNYHNYLITNINANIRTTKNHMLYLDTLQMDIAGGHMDIGGYFNGSDRNDIYFYPNISLQQINLDKLMLKFDNFGQDEVLSDQLHGNINGRLSGKIHMHADLTPMLDASKINIDVDIVGGSIENYGPLQALAGFFDDKSLHKVIFDTLRNNMVLENGVMTVPEMIINTNLGFIAVSGKQDMDMNMEYYLRVPLKMISSVGSRKLFGSGKDRDPEQLADYDPNKRYRFVNIKIVGDAEDFKVSLGKNRN
jgi:predicted small secreted protein